MNRKTLFFPAFDKTDPNPEKNFGVGCIDIRFTVEGKNGMVEFELSTNWYLPLVMDRRLQNLKNDTLLGKEDFLLRNYINPYPLDLCYFSPTRLGEDDCEWELGVEYFRNGQPCFYGYKFKDENENVAKDIAFSKLLEDGDEALWKYLEEYYIETFGADE